MRTVLIFLFITCFTIVKSQNIIQNGDFGQKGFCPTNLQQYGGPFPYTHWREANTADAFDSCWTYPVNPWWNAFGYATGNAFVGMWGVSWGSFSSERIIQDFAPVSGLYAFSMDVHLSQLNWGNSTPCSFLVIFNQDTIQTPVFDQWNWVTWDTIIQITGDSIRIQPGGIMEPWTNNSYYYLDNIKLISLSPLEIILPNNEKSTNPTPKVITRSFDLLGRNLSP